MNDRLAEVAQLSKVDLKDRTSGLPYESFSVGKPAPKFKEVAANSIGRSNLIEISGLPDSYPVSNQRTERQVVDDFASFLQNQKGKLKGEDLAKIIQLETDLNFIGEPELVEATEALAKNIAADWQEGKKLFFYMPPARRSEFYILLRVLEVAKAKYGIEINNYHRRPQNNPVTVVDNLVSLRAVTGYSPEKSVVYLLDDFIVSGNNLKNNVDHVFDYLIGLGITPEQVAKMIKVGVVAAPENKILRNYFKLSYDNEKTGEEEIYPLQTYTHFGISESQANFVKSCFTGSFCPVDYSFTEVLAPILERQNLDKKTEYPYLMRVVKPYDAKSAYHLLDRWADLHK